jgi:hypothetical protein
MKKIKSERIEEIISYIENEARCIIPEAVKETIMSEIDVSYKLNGHISQSYIDNLIKAYHYSKKEAAPSVENAASA